MVTVPVQLENQKTAAERELFALFYALLASLPVPSVFWERVAEEAHEPTRHGHILCRTSFLPSVICRYIDVSSRTFPARHGSSLVCYPVTFLQALWRSRKNSFCETPRNSHATGKGHVNMDCMTMSTVEYTINNKLKKRYKFLKPVPENRNS